MSQRVEGERTTPVIKIQDLDLIVLERRRQNFLDRISEMPIPKHSVGYSGEGDPNDPKSYVYCQGGLPIEITVSEKLKREGSGIEVKLFANAECSQDIDREKKNLPQSKPWFIDEEKFDHWVLPRKI